MEGGGIGGAGHVIWGGGDASTNNETDIWESATPPTGVTKIDKTELIEFCDTLGVTDSDVPYYKGHTT